MWWLCSAAFVRHVVLMLDWFQRWVHGRCRPRRLCLHCSLSFFFYMGTFRRLSLSYYLLTRDGFRVYFCVFAVVDVVVTLIFPGVRSTYIRDCNHWNLNFVGNDSCDIENWMAVDSQQYYRTIIARNVTVFLFFFLFFFYILILFFNFGHTI